jgi:hypothetical protein
MSSQPPKGLLTFLSWQGLCSGSQAAGSCRCSARLTLTCYSSPLSVAKAPLAISMKRLAFFLFGLFLSLSVLGVEKVWADAGHHHPNQASHSQSQSLLSYGGSPDVHLRLSDHRHGNTDDCDGICASCCAMACGATALNGVTVILIRRLSGEPVQFAMIAQPHGRYISPPLPPPRS